MQINSKFGVWWNSSLYRAERDVPWKLCHHICSVWPDVPVGYSESDYKKPICKVRVQCTRSLASEYKLDTEPASQLHLEHYIGDEDISETD